MKNEGALPKHTKREALTEHSLWPVETTFSDTSFLPIRVIFTKSVFFFLSLKLVFVFHKWNWKKVERLPPPVSDPSLYSQGSDVKRVLFPGPVTLWFIGFVIRCWDTRHERLRVGWNQRFLFCWDFSRWTSFVRKSLKVSTRVSGFYGLKWNFLK